jgi:FHS family Na+ dependent glucose MFS transporter 1
LGLADETGAAYLTSAFWGALTAGRLLAIPISARVRPRLILLGDLIGALISLSLILLWPRSPAMLWIGALGMGLSLASIFPTMMSLAEREMHVTGQVTGWFLVGASAGSMSVPWLIGQLFEWQGPRVMVVAIGIDLLAAVLLWGVLGIAGQSAGRTAVEAEA